MPDQDQSHLLIAFKNGDRGAFEQVFKAHYAALRLSAYLILKDEQEAEDQVQQLFLDLWNQRLYQNIQQSVKAYLHTSIKNRCLNYVKKLTQQAKTEQIYAGQLESQTSLQDQHTTPLDIFAILNELPTQRLKAINLVHLENKRYHEAAEEMGISINSLKSHLKLAVKSLRVKLKVHTIHPYND